MKKSILFLFLICNSVLFSQTVLTSYALDLKKYDEDGQILNAENPQTHDVFAFVKGSDTFTILKYNRSLFLTNKYTDSLPDLENRSIVGCSFSEDGNPTVYWATPSYNNIRIAKYYLENKTRKVLNFDLPSFTQFVITQFQVNNTFYILTKEKLQPHLILYTFKNGICETRMLDFSTFTFMDEKGSRYSFNTIIQKNPIEKIDPEDYAPIYKTTGKTKIYIQDNHLILTFDYNSKKTQLFEINIDNTQIIEKTFPQPLIKNGKTSNSFFCQNKLFQINANKEEFVFAIKDYDSGQTIKNIPVSKKDTIQFKNSPLLIQTNNRSPRKLKNTAKFLENISSLDIGLSVFQNKKNTFITIGGFSSIQNWNSFGHFNSLNDFLTNFDAIFIPNNNPSFENMDTRTVYFQSMWNTNLEPLNQEQSPMAMDKVFYFLDNHKEAVLENTMKYSDFVIMGYYDSVKRQYIMRKFKDGFDWEETINPLINKSPFSKSFRFKKH